MNVTTRIIQTRHDRSCLWSDSNLKQYSCLEIFDQQGNPFHTFPWVDFHINTFKIHDEIKGRNAKNKVVEGEFQIVMQRTCAYYSYLKEEDDDVGDSIEPAMST